MTLVVGLTCDEGVVLASDSQVSSGATRDTGQKIWAVPEAPFIFGLSGVDSTMQLLSEALVNLRFDSATVAGVRTSISELATRILEREYERVRRVMGSLDRNSLPAAGVVAGAFIEGRPRLLVADHYGSVTERAGFVADGGSAVLGRHAATVFRVLRAQSLSLHQAKMLAFRVVQDAIEIAGPSLALNGPIQMATLSKSGNEISAMLLEPDDPTISEAVQSWILAEAERFLAHAPPEASG